ncbi:MAG: VOC family protein [bacterium]|nr:VOC family protein [bacterium]
MFGQNKVHANFSVDNLEAARSFYVDKLGFREKESMEGVLVLEAGESTAINIYEKSDHQPWNATVLGIETDDVHDAIRLLKDAGVEVERLDGTDESGVMSSPEMGKAAWLKDPAGNWVCISSRP